MGCGGTGAGQRLGMGWELLQNPSKGILTLLRSPFGVRRWWEVRIPIQVGLKCLFWGFLYFGVQFLEQLSFPPLLLGIPQQEFFLPKVGTERSLLLSWNLRLPVRPLQSHLSDKIEAPPSPLRGLQPGFCSQISPPEHGGIIQTPQSPAGAAPGWNSPRRAEFSQPRTNLGLLRLGKPLQSILCLTPACHPHHSQEFPGDGDPSTFP